MRMDCHMHSTYSDGRNSLEEMIEAAIGLGYEAMAVTDHVWRTTPWVPQYAAHLRELRDRYRGKISILAGIEAKVIDLSGDIDADESFDQNVDIILGSMHRIPNSTGFYSRRDRPPAEPGQIYEDWWKAMKGLLANPRVRVIAHPLAEFENFSIHPSNNQLDTIAKAMRDSGKVIELNVRHQAPGPRMVELLATYQVPVVISSDSHSVADLKRYSPDIERLSARRDLNRVDLGKLLAH